MTTSARVSRVMSPPLARNRSIAYRADARIQAMASSERFEQRGGLLLELFILRRPIRVQRRSEHELQLALRVVLPVHLEIGFGQEVMCRGALGRVGQRLLEMLDRFVLAAAEEARDPQVPTSERAVG